MFCIKLFIVNVQQIYLHEIHLNVNKFHSIGNETHLISSDKFIYSSSANLETIRVSVRQITSLALRSIMRGWWGMVVIPASADIGDFAHRPKIRTNKY